MRTTYTIEVDTTKSFTSRDLDDGIRAVVGNWIDDGDLRYEIDIVEQRHDDQRLRAAVNAIIDALNGHCPIQLLPHPERLTEHDSPRDVRDTLVQIADQVTAIGDQSRKALVDRHKALSELRTLKRSANTLAAFFRDASES